MKKKTKHPHPPKEQHKTITKKTHTKTFVKSIFWFSIGVFLGLFLLISFVFIYFQKTYETKVYPGVTITGINFSGKTKQEVQQYFEEKNTHVQNVPVVFSADNFIATSSAQQLNMGYNSKLLADQAYSIGRSSDMLVNLRLILSAYLNGLSLPASYQYSDNNLNALLTPLAKNVHKDPVNAQFSFTNGRVTTFKPSSDGKDIDTDKIKKELFAKTQQLVNMQTTQPINIAIAIKTISPDVTTDEANSLGIKELIASGTSLFAHSIPSRVYNVTLAASRVNGVLIKPGEEFSFDKALGDVSEFTGYKQAYVIQNGKTVLGDGGGVCQVSTTFFRALLNAGLPITERHAHAYRVGYYEEDSPPGIDATIYVPSVDLKFKNDTGHHILVQTEVDPVELRLNVYLYGTKDNRQVTMTKPVITNQTPAPEPQYQDDPTLPKGEVKQIDFAAAGATVSFKRTVTKDGKTIIADTYTSYYRPWQAVYMRGTKE
jgi:vancomycin resistance protein YoaR